MSSVSSEFGLRFAHELSSYHRARRSAELLAQRCLLTSVYDRVVPKEIVGGSTRAFDPARHHPRNGGLPSARDLHLDRRPSKSRKSAEANVKLWLTERGRKGRKNTWQSASSHALRDEWRVPTCPQFRRRQHRADAVATLCSPPRPADSRSQYSGRRALSNFQTIYSGS